MSEISVRHETYPGTLLYFLIDDRRYSGPEGLFVPLDQHAIDALKKAAIVDYAWHDWPSKREHNLRTILGGFAEGYEECREFLSSAAKHPKRGASPAK